MLMGSGFAQLLAACKYNGTANTVTSKYGIASVTKNTFTFAATLGFAHYWPDVDSSAHHTRLETAGASSLRVKRFDSANAAADSDLVEITVFGIIQRR
jgi:hypothetical protein